MMTANIYGLFYAHRLMYRPFVCKMTLPTATICSYTPLASIPFTESISSTQQKANKKGRARQGSLPPFRQKFPATALPLFLPHFTSIYH